MPSDRHFVKITPENVQKNFAQDMIRTYALVTGIAKDNNLIDKSLIELTPLTAATIIVSDLQ